MRLTSFFDYSLRVLLFLGTIKKRSSVAEISQAYAISRNHVVKVAHNLVNLGYVRSAKGKNGGLTLAMDPAEINLGKLIEQIEPDFDLVECFDRGTNGCCIASVCGLKGILARAKKAFVDSLKQYSLADIIKDKHELIRLIIPPARVPSSNGRIPLKS